MNQYMWTRDAAIAVATQLESIAPQFGAHIALTGGCLYKDGPRKDCDFIVYRIRQRKVIDVDGFLDAARQFGITLVRDYGFCVKMVWNECHKMDFLFPDRETSGTYPQKDEFDLESLI